jgi:hypothetical protein
MPQQIGELVIRRKSPNDTDGQSVGGALSQVTMSDSVDEIQLDTYLKDRRSERGVELGLTSHPMMRYIILYHSLSSSIIIDEIQLDTYLKYRRSERFHPIIRQ